MVKLNKTSMENNNTHININYSSKYTTSLISNLKRVRHQMRLFYYGPFILGTNLLCDSITIGSMNCVSKKEVNTTRHEMWDFGRYYGWGYPVQQVEQNYRYAVNRRRKYMYFCLVNIMAEEFYCYGICRLSDDQIGVCPLSDKWYVAALFYAFLHPSFLFAFSI